jgi:hypothetical protein
MLEHALAYAEMDWPVFPLKIGGKRPATRNGFHSATTDPEIIESWWTRHPNMNIGLACGAAGLVVVDVDRLAAVRELRDRGFRLPPTLAQITPSNGCHYFYQAHWTMKNTAGMLPGVGKIDGVDLRADGGYVVVPPSEIPDTTGERYDWVCWPGTVADCPDWLKETPRPRTTVTLTDRLSPEYLDSALRDERNNVRFAVRGTRNATLNTAAFSLGQLVWRGLDLQTVVNELLSAAHAVGLGEREARRTIQSGLEAGLAEPRA